MSPCTSYVKVSANGVPQFVVRGDGQLFVYGDLSVAGVTTITGSLSVRNVSPRLQLATDLSTRSMPLPTAAEMSNVCSGCVSHDAATTLTSFRDQVSGEAQWTSSGPTGVVQTMTTTSGLGNALSITVPLSAIGYALVLRDVGTPPISILDVSCVHAVLTVPAVCMWCV